MKKANQQNENDLQNEACHEGIKTSLLINIYVHCNVPFYFFSGKEREICSFIWNLIVWLCWGCDGTDGMWGREWGKRSVLLKLPYHYTVCITQSHHIIAPSSINSTILLACLARETRETGPRPVQRWEEEEATSILRPPPARPQLLIWSDVYLYIDLLDSTNNPKSVGLEVVRP